MGADTERDRLEALVAEWKRRRSGLTFSAAETRKYLLSGLLRCGRMHSDGAVCNRAMSGTGYARGTVTGDTTFNIVPRLEARERQLKSDLAKKTKIRHGRLSRAQSPDDVRRDWNAGDIGVRRAILSRYLKAVAVRKSALAGRRLLDFSAIEPIWLTGSDPMPDDGYLTP
jgi:hypothetical protein